MKTTSVAVRRGLAGTFAVTALGGVMVTSFGVPSAGAGQDPCAASQVAKTIGMVATSTGTYLDAHPTANQTLTNISQQQPGPQSLAALKTYFDANPQEGAALQNLHFSAEELAEIDAHAQDGGVDLWRAPNTDWA